MPKKGSFAKKKLKFDHSLVFLGFTCVHFLLDVLNMWLADLLTTIFTKKMSDLICTCDLYLVLYIEHYLHPAYCHVVEYVLISVNV